MMQLILNFNDKAIDTISKGADVEEVSGLPVREKIGRFKYVPEEKTDAEFERINVEISSEFSQLLSRREN